MDLRQAEKIYFVGLGGIGTSALARLFLNMGKQVSGSDLKQTNILENLRMMGVEVFIGHDGKHLDTNPDAVIYSLDVTADSPGFVEIEAAKKKEIPVIDYSKALAELMRGSFEIAVTGTNGKSTTTALLGLMLEKAELDPSVVLGSQVSPKNSSREFQANARLGKSKFFIAEADEYHRKMLDLNPDLIIITNIAEDHLDYYKDLSDIKSVFLEFIEKLPKDGILIYNADDHNTVEVCREAKCHKFTFGIHHYADLQAMNRKSEVGSQIFDMHLNDQKIGTFELLLPGSFNISNALGASLAAIKLGVSFKVIKQVLSEFAGIWRRFEKVGELQGKPIISDYGHHPAGVAATIEASKEFYPQKKILVVFQPHHRNRTKKLFNEFVGSLLMADEVILPEIFDVAGREHGEEISSSMLVAELMAKGVMATFAPNLDETERLIKQKLNNFDAILLMGAGDIDLLARRIIQ